MGFVLLLLLQLLLIRYTAGRSNVGNRMTTVQNTSYCGRRHHRWWTLSGVSNWRHGATGTHHNATRTRAGNGVDGNLHDVHHGTAV
uniref:Putative secreted protein n=1 Tax=Anopheles marajoara TaxID=58244 RepID=A0A2M4CAL4_9DIPT